PRGRRVTATLPADQEVRDRLLDELETTFFVEAGAGTGKTTALVSRIVELVARDELAMERLAAITFTEAAAAELRDRLREVLDQAFPERRSAVRRALALGITAEQLRELANRLQEYRDLLEPTTVWPQPAVADPVAVSRRWGASLLDLASNAEHEALNPDDN